MSQLSNSLILVFTAGIVTVLIRAFPFLLFGGKREMPKGVKKVADILPAAIMGVLVIYCVKNDIISARNLVVHQNTDGLVSLIAKVAALVGVVGIHLKQRQMLFSIAAGTVIYMVLIRVLPGIL